jgi:hypothetical protein
MDTNNGPTTGAGGSGKQPQEELRNELEAMGHAAADLLEHLVRVPAALAQIPLQYLPEDTAGHARNAATEGFKAVKTLIDTISAQVDEMMAQQSRRSGTQTGAGTPPPAEPSSGETTHMGGASGTNGSSTGEPTRRLDDEG